MKVKMNKKVFIILISILLILICIVSILLYKTSKEDLNKNEDNIFQNSIVNNTQINDEEDEEFLEENIKETHAKEIQSMNDLLSVQQCIDAFLFNASMESYNGINLYDILDKEYMEKYNLEKSTLANIASEYYGDFSFIIKSCYTHEISENLNMYFVYGDLINRELYQKQEKSFILKIDKTNSAYSIFLENYILDNGYTKENIREKDLIEISKVSMLEKYRFNEYKQKEYSNQDYCIYYFGIYSTYLQYYPEGLYDILDKEYREKRFGNFDNMKNYIEKNKEELFGDILLKYAIEEYDDGIKYSCMDGNGRRRIINATSPTNYSIMLDTYTIDTKEILENYDDSSTNGKMKININRFLQSIKSFDYEYAYNKLNDDFKMQYFKTINEFEEYARTIFVYGQSIELEDYTEEEENIYTYVVLLKSVESTLETTFTVELLEGTDYKISFNINAN